MVKIALGLDFGTESVRALLVDMHGNEQGQAVKAYPHGQITRQLPTTGETLPADFALQNPQDWIDSAASAVRSALRVSRIEPRNIIGIGVDFTSCTMLPALADGTPLCDTAKFAGEKYAWPKLWKHHGAKSQAERLTAIARQRKEPWLDQYGGTIGLEWFFPKMLETLERAPPVYEAAEVWLEAGDWFVWQLTGLPASDLARSTCQAGYKAMWSGEQGFPSPDFLRAVHPKLKTVTSTKMPGRFVAPGQPAGLLCAAMAEKLGLVEGISVSAAVIDAHAGVPGCGAGEPGTLVMVMGTSSCHMLNAASYKSVPGVAGIVKDGILPGMVGYETGQAAVGDGFNWLRNLLGKRDFTGLDRESASLPPGSDGVTALDWLNGCRTPLMDGSLKAVFDGLTLSHGPAHLYRSLLEGSAFGLRWIVDLLREHDVPVKRFMATGGLPHHNPQLVQIYADVLGAPVEVHPSKYGPALGAAILGACASGRASGFGDVTQAIRAMALPPAVRRQIAVFKPKPAAVKAYAKPYARYRALFSRYSSPSKIMSNPPPNKQIQLIASGDLRLSANHACWPEQQKMEAALARAVAAEGWTVVRAPGADVIQTKGHGFIDSQKMGMEVFRALDPYAPLVVAEAVWQYSHHVLAGLTTHRGPILTVANFSGTWPGLVGLLNLNASLTKAGVKYSTLWSENFDDAFFKDGLHEWLTTGAVSHDQSHVRALSLVKLPAEDERMGRDFGRRLRERKSILGVFDEGCMGMFNAIVPDELLHPTGFFKERLSQSTLFAAMNQVHDDEAGEVLTWLKKRGITFNFGTDETTTLTEGQVLQQCKMYVAALRLADEFGCAGIGIQYQQGLKDLTPASDLVEGMLNNVDRPPVRSADGERLLFDGEALPHFNEVDECAGIDGVVTYHLWRELKLSPENTLHDLRWGQHFKGGSVDDFVWVLLISGAAPPEHFEGGWKGASSERQPPMYFRLGGGTLKGVSKPGQIVWSRVFVAEDKLQCDIGVAEAVALPKEETERRWRETTPQWPIMHLVFNGITRDQMMARHKSNHIQVAYVSQNEDAARVARIKAAAMAELGIEVHFCGNL